MSSNDGTVDNEATVLFRRKDLEGFVERLRGSGHYVEPLDLAPGQGVIDQYLDLPPYREHPHLKMALFGYAATSVGLLIRKSS